ncbi:MAG: fibronectin type III domain-containing protein [Deltaproteobacteria bacterium]|nr:fibronectin type III domain-containing protein [Deltaproteobacteria bacterium]
MRAYNSAGNSSYCDEANATTYPAAPSGLSASAASSSQITLLWTDNSSGESGFKIERKTGSYSQIATVSANTTSYSSTGLSEATIYYYRVRAYNSAGNSNYSNEVNATTPSAGGGGGGCFIATAAYGSYMEPHVMVLRDFRDRVLLTNNVGRSFVELYYTYSPPVANFISNHDTVRLMVRWSLLPVVGVSWMSLNIGLSVTLTLMGLLICFMGAGATIALRRMRIRRQS